MVESHVAHLLGQMVRVVLALKLGLLYLRLLLLLHRNLLLLWLESEVARAAVDIGGGLLLRNIELLLNR